MKIINVSRLKNLFRCGLVLWLLIAVNHPLWGTVTIELGAGDGENLCLNESGYLYAFDEDPPEPPDASSCCKDGNTGSWSLDDTFYHWYGDLTQSGDNALLNTTSAGWKQAEVYITYYWSCSVDDSNTPQNISSGDGWFNVEQITVSDERGGAPFCLSDGSGGYCYANGAAMGSYSWSSSNTDVCDVSDLGGGTAWMSFYKRGKTTISASDANLGCEADPHQVTIGGAAISGPTSIPCGGSITLHNEYLSASGVNSQLLTF